MINIYIEPELIKFENFRLALLEIKKLQVNVTILSPDKYDDFENIDKNFNELLKSYEKLTKDETYISFNTDNLYRWDLNRGKHIYAVKKHNSKELCCEFNKIFLYDEYMNIFKELRKYIHI